MTRNFFLEIAQSGVEAKCGTWHCHHASREQGRMLAQLGNAIALVLLPFLQLNLEVDLVEKDPSMRQALLKITKLARILRLKIGAASVRCTLMRRRSLPSSMAWSMQRLCSQTLALHGVEATLECARPVQWPRTTWSTFSNTYFRLEVLIVLTRNIHADHCQEIYDQTSKRREQQSIDNNMVGGIQAIPCWHMVRWARSTPKHPPLTWRWLQLAPKMKVAGLEMREKRLSLVKDSQSKVN